MLLSRSDTPMPVEHPGTLLALFAAVFRPPAPPAFGKLASELLPLPTLVVRTLPYPVSAVVLAAEIPHHDASPVLHVLAVMPDRELLNKREDVEVIWEEVFFFVRVTRGRCGR